LEREKEERKDAELTVAGLKRQLATLRDKIASVDTDIEQYRALAQNLHRGTPRPLSYLLSPLRSKFREEQRKINIKLICIARLA
jgi:kinetochore protein Spc25